VSAVALLAIGCQAPQTAPIEPSGGKSPGGAGNTPDATTVAETGTTSTTPTLVSGIFSPQAIAVGASSVYWTTSRAALKLGEVGDATAGTGAVESVASTGGSITDVVVGLTSPVALAVSGTTLFFGQGSGSSGVLDAYTLGSIAVDTVASAQSAPLAMVLDESVLYWATGSGTQFAADSVIASATPEGSVKPLSSAMAAYVPVAVAVIGASVYVLATAGGTAYLLSVPAVDGPPTELWHEASVTPVDLGGAGESLYWTLANTSANGGELLSMSILGGTPVTLADEIANAAKIAISAPNVYFTSNVAGGSVLSVSTGGGAVSTLASGLDYPYPIAVGSGSLYVGTASAIVVVPQ